MNNRVLSVVMFVTVLTLSSGCSGMKSFLFGKGASCGICKGGASQIGGAMANPCGCPPGTHAYNGPVGESVCGYDYVDPYTTPGTGSTGTGSTGQSGSNGADGFNARKFDSDGSPIVWEETKPDGTAL